MKKESSKIIKTSVPGSVMLLGEHAVLRGYPAVVASVAKKISVKLSVREDQKVKIDAGAFGEIEFNLTRIPNDKAFRFVLKAISYYQQKLKLGFDLKISAGFSDKVGLGSSAAVTVAVVSALEKLTTGKIDKVNVFQKSLQIMREIQKVGSGADIAASVFGGVISYKINASGKVSIKQYELKLPIHLIYVGYKTPTVEVIKKVTMAEKKSPKKFQEIFAAIGNCTNKGIKAIANADIYKLGKIFSEHQKLQAELGVSDKNIDEIIANLSSHKAIFGAKISGSGLGDCVIALGVLPENHFPLNKKQEKQGVIQIL